MKLTKKINEKFHGLIEFSGIDFGNICITKKNSEQIY